MSGCWSSVIPLHRRLCGMVVATGVLLALAVCVRRPAHPKTEMVLLVAASVSNAASELVKAFEKANSGLDVTIGTGASSSLAKQIAAGAPADVFLPASEDWVHELKSQGLVAEDRLLMGNRLVLVVPRGNPAGIVGLRSLQLAVVTRVALAGESVPAGKYADQVLHHADLFESLQKQRKLVRAADVRAALAWVERREADAGIVYATDAQISSDVEVVEVLSESAHDPIVYRALLTKAGDANPVAKAFMTFLGSQDAQAILERHGFSPIGNPDNERPTP